MDPYSFKAGHFGDRGKGHFGSKDFYLLNFSESDHVIISFVHIMYLIISMAHYLLWKKCIFFNHSVEQNPCVSTEFDLTYITNLLSTQYPDWFPSSIISIIVLNALRFIIVDFSHNWIQREPIKNKEAYKLIDQFDHNTKYSYRDLNTLIENPFFYKSRGFQISFLEYQDPIVEWLEKSYVASSYANNKF